MSMRSVLCQNIVHIARIVYIGQSFQYRHILHSFVHNIGTTWFADVAAGAAGWPLVSESVVKYTTTSNRLSLQADRAIAAAMVPVPRAQDPPRLFLPIQVARASTREALDAGRSLVPAVRA